MYAFCVLIFGKIHGYVQPDAASWKILGYLFTSDDDVYQKHEFAKRLRETVVQTKQKSGRRGSQNFGLHRQITDKF